MKNKILVVSLQSQQKPQLIIMRDRTDTELRLRVCGHTYPPTLQINPLY